MNTVARLGVLGLCASLSVACGRGADTERNDPDDDIDIEQTSVINETGCLTSSGGRYVLTALESGGRAETELYQLVGNDSDLRQHVGKEVRVTGDAEPGQVAEIREGGATAPSGTSGSSPTSRDGATPQVTTESSTRLETRQLRVATIMPTGDDCTESTTRR